jgi:hypothetical protein
MNNCVYSGQLAGIFSLLSDKSGLVRIRNDLCALVLISAL